jgi:hypothetical protein
MILVVRFCGQVGALMLLLLAFLSAVTGALFGVLLAVVVPHVDAVAALALLAASLWVCRLEVLPGLASLWVWPARRLPPPTLWTAITAAILGYLACLLKFAAHFLRLLNSTAVGILPVPSFAATVLSAIISAIFYILLLSHLLSWKHDRREDRVNGGQPGAGSRPCQQPNAQAAGQKRAADTGGVTPETIEAILKPSDPDTADFIIKLLHWLDGPENPVDQRQEDIFGFDAAAQKMKELLRPSYPRGPAGTVYLVGKRGGGKSTLLRLTAAPTKGTKNGVSLKFCFVSLWDHPDMRTALNAVLASAMESIRHEVDIIPLCGAINSLAEALLGRQTVGILDIAAAPPSERWLPALSEVLLQAGTRLIFCIEDTDRISPSDKMQEYFTKIEGFLDAVKRYPGFGYVVCGTEPVWSERVPTQIHSGEPPDEKAAKDALTLKDFGVAGGAIAGAEAEALKQFQQDAEVFAARHGYLPIPRLITYELNLQAFLSVQIRPVLQAFRHWMVQQVDPTFNEPIGALAHVAGVDARYRYQSFEAFLRDASTFALLPHLTPRVLRNGLREARRRWLNIARDAITAARSNSGQAAQACIDPDSVLVACLVLACFPERRRRAEAAGLGDWCDRPLIANARDSADAISANPSSPGLEEKQREMRRIAAGLSRPVEEVLRYSTERLGGIYGVDEQARKNWKIFIGA